MKIKCSYHLPFFISMAFTGALIAFRIAYSGNTIYLFLVWNLFLAWIPLLISDCLVSGFRNKFVRNIYIIIWLLFFPNSLYIITDLLHLKERQGVPLWYDSVLIFSAICNGVTMAFASLEKIEFFLLKYLANWKCKSIILICLFLSSFGIYIGRFLRLNSWDVFIKPISVLTQISERFFYPSEHPRTWGVTIIFTLFFSVLYFSIKTLKRVL